MVQNVFESKNGVFQFDILYKKNINESREMMFPPTIALLESQGQI